MKTLYIIISIFLILLAREVKSQNSFEIAHDFGILQEGNFEVHNEQYIPRSGKVYHRFEITTTMHISISHCIYQEDPSLTYLSDTYMTILYESGEVYTTNDDSVDGNGELCPNSSHASILEKEMPKGVYYIVSEGEDRGQNEQGVIRVNIKGTLPKKTYSIGRKNSTFHYTHTQNTNYCGNHYGKSSNDIFYIFRITKPMDITISHCGSDPLYTLVYVLDANGDIVASHDVLLEKTMCDYKGHAYLRIPDLPIGTYTVVSEGYNQNGNITTTIEGYCPEVENMVGNSNLSHIYTRTYTYNQTKPYLDNIEYFDGLGRPLQTVQCGITPSGKDLVTYQEYDTFGRESNTWLPIVGENNNNGNHVPFNVLKDIVPSTYADNLPFSKPVYEASPLNRVLEEYGPGQDWHNNKKSIKTYYDTNDDEYEDLECTLYRVIQSQSGIRLEKVGNYENGSLYVINTKDEDGNYSFEFKDKLGQVILTRQINNNQNHDTYYVYDDFGNLCYVLPPLASDVLVQNNQSWDESNEILKKYAYLYKYDERNRCIWKGLPGCEPMYYVYDKADQLILSQDGEQRKENKWAFNIYDALGRLIISGYQPITGSHTDLINRYQNVVIKENSVFTVPGPPYSYTWSTFPDVDYTGVQIINHYDTPRMITSYFPNLAYMEKQGYGKIYNENEYSSKGLLSATRVKLSDGSSEIITVMYYDERGRVIQTQSTNHLGGTDKEFIEYNFTGQPTKKLLVHNIEGQPEITELYSYTYDHAGRLKETTHSLNGANPVLLVYNQYDELGRLKSTKANNNEELKLTYDYNIRSWVKEISGSLFSQKLFYNELVSDKEYGSFYYDVYNKPSYNGNISKMYAGSSNYNFYYDNMSRLTSAVYMRSTLGTKRGITYAVNYEYDNHGNMTNLIRFGPTTSSPQFCDMIDDLQIYHNGNQISKIYENAEDPLTNTSYDFRDYSGGADGSLEYNTNGAMTKDPYKGMTVKYNIQNLPERIDVKNPITEGAIRYTYTSSGQKLRAEHASVIQYSVNPIENTGNTGADRVIRRTKTEYIGNKIYYYEFGKRQELDKILFDNGYIEDGIYYFYLRDHLGNNRIVADLNGEVVQRNDYYPFGMSYSSYEENTSVQPYKYGGKEFEPMHGINLYDFHARQYNSVLGSFDTMDPLAEKGYQWSPYAYCFNNPLKFVDPDGKFPWLIPVIIGALLLNSTPANAPTLDSKANGQAMREAYDSYNDRTIGIISGSAIVPSLMRSKSNNKPASDQNNNSNTSPKENKNTTDISSEGKTRNKPKEEGIPNSSEIQSRDLETGQIDKYTTFDGRGKFVKEYRGSGKDHGKIPRPNIKEPKVNTNPKTGETFQNGYIVRPARPNEIPKSRTK